MIDDIKRFFTFISTWVLFIFAGLAAAWQAFPPDMLMQLYAAYPKLQAVAPAIWFATFLLVFYKARMTPQGIDVPK